MKNVGFTINERFFVLALGKTAWVIAGLLFCSIAIAEENASNPLAAVSNTDLRVKYFNLDEGDRMDYFVDGSTMLNPKLKLKYEVHYWDTDAAGHDESDWESASLKMIYFAKEGKLSADRPYRLAVGFEWIRIWVTTKKGSGAVRTS